MTGKSVGHSDSDILLNSRKLSSYKEFPLNSIIGVLLSIQNVNIFIRMSSNTAVIVYIFWIGLPSISARLNTLQ